MEIKIELSDSEWKALAYAAADPTEWANNVVKERARISMDNIFQNEVQRMMADPEITQIPADREAVVMAAELPTPPLVQAILPNPPADNN